MTADISHTVRSQTIGDLLRRTAKRFPDKLAIVCGEVSWTYKEFDAVCNSVANSLSGLGVQAGDKVAILSRNSHAFAAIRFALARLGAVLVPINFMLNVDEVAYVLKHSGAGMLLVDSEHAETGQKAAALDTQVTQILGLPSEASADTLAGVPGFDGLLKGDPTPVSAPVDGRDILQIIYTSGTESAPKGAVLTHEAVIAQYVTCIADVEINERDTIVHSMPLYHCAQLDCFLGPSVYVGGTNIITAQPTAENILGLIQNYKANSFFAPPTIWIALLRSDLFDGTDLTSLQKGYYGASIMPVEIIKEMIRRLPDLRLWNLYGQTEIAPLATVLKPEDQLRKAGSAGRPGLNIETRVVSDEGDDVAPGEVGEIVHRSPQLILGYLNDADKTADAFEGGWFHSGDLATIDEDGFITVVDRKKDMIKSGGENVSSREVEETIYGLEGISEVAVIGLPDPKWIEKVSAIIVLKDGESLTEDDVKAHCSAAMSGFKVPKSVFFTDSLPKNPSGKILKRELRAEFQEA